MEGSISAHLVSDRRIDNFKVDFEANLGPHGLEQFACLLLVWVVVLSHQLNFSANRLRSIFEQ